MINERRERKEASANLRRARASGRMELEERREVERGGREREKKEEG